MRRIFMIAATAIFLFPASLQAQEVTESHLSAARAAIDAINATDQFDQILPNAATQVKSELIANNPDREAAISEMVDNAALELAPRRAALENEVARVYANLFTEEELTAIANFYQSGAGQKLLAQGPLATRNMLEAAEVWSSGIVRDLRQAAFEGLREMTAGAAPAADEGAQN